MKKFLLTMVCAMMSLVGMAQLTKPFVDNLVVTINGESTEPQETTVYLTLNEDNTCDFSLNNFMLGAGDGDFLPVGNIFIAGLPLSLSDEGYYTFTYDNNLVISAGDAPEFVEDDWLGPKLGEIPLKLSGKATMDKVYVTIDIDMMETIEQIIYVTFGSDFPTTGNAIEYKDNLVISVNDVVTDPIPAIVQLVDKQDGTYSFSLKNFIMELGGDVMPVGNIELSGLTLSPVDNYMTFQTSQIITIAPGDPGFVVNVEGEDYTLTDEDWIGPALGDIPVSLDGKVDYEKMFVNIDIVMEGLGQTIHVTFGSDFEPVTPPAPTTYALTFEVDGQTISTAELEAGATVTYPELPLKEGYTFAWEGETVATMPAEALTIKGSYTVNSYTVTYKDGDKVVATFTVNFGEAMPEAPQYQPESDDRYTRTLLGWQGETCNTMPSHDVTYTAVVDIVDAIKAVAADRQAETFDLQGRRVTEAKKSAVIIKNGKKILK